MYVSRRQRRGALMGADAGSDWVSARLSPGTLGRIEQSAGRRRTHRGNLGQRGKHRGARAEAEAEAEAARNSSSPLVLQHIFLA